MKNVLLLAMSTLGKDTKEKDNYYTYEGGEVFKGRSQLEPITHMLSIERKKQGEWLDKIIILETEKTRKSEDGEEISAVDFYKSRVKEFLDADVQDKELYEDIPIDENDPAEGVAKATEILLREYDEQKKKGDGMNLWIDTQGGFRDVAMVFNAIISLLREQGIEPKGIYGIRFSGPNSEENPAPIVNQSKNYDIFKFVSAMQEFMDYSKATGLKKYYGEENEFVRAIDSIAEAIQMCQPQKFEEAVREFADCIEDGCYKINDPYLRNFVEFMKNDYGVLLRQPDNTIEQIRWCVKKGFYQQALTIYVEQMPKYYHDRGIVTLNVDVEEKSSRGSNVYADAFYKEMFDEMIQDDNDILLQDILSAAAGYEAINDLRKAERYLAAEARKINNEKVKKAVHEVINRLKERYERDGQLKNPRSEDKGPKKIQGYINGMCGGSGKWKRYELLYGVLDANKRDGKKITAIRKAKENAPGLARIMEYYIAVKHLRNRMNHASEDKANDQGEEEIAFLRAEGIDLGIQTGKGGFRLDYQKVEKLILNGLEASTENEK